MKGTTFMKVATKFGTVTAIALSIAGSQSTAENFREVPGSRVKADVTLTPEQEKSKQLVLQYMTQSFDGFPYGYSEPARPGQFKSLANNPRDGFANVSNSPAGNLTKANLKALLSDKYHVSWRFDRHEEGRYWKRFVDVKFYGADGRFLPCVIERMKDGSLKPVSIENPARNWIAKAGIHVFGAAGYNQFSNLASDLPKSEREVWPVNNVFYDANRGALNVEWEFKHKKKSYYLHSKGSLQDAIPAFAVDVCPHLPRKNINKDQTSVVFEEHMADTSTFYKNPDLVLFPQDLMNPLTFRKVFWDYEGDQSEFASVPKTW